jgi:Xaa-Pro aminopeptidase
MVDVQPVIQFRGGGLTAGGAGGLSGTGVADVLGSATVARIGLENWDRFPLSLYLALRSTFPSTQFVQSTLVEELRLVKTAYEIGVFEQCGKVADAGHVAFVDALRDGVGKSELELVRIADHAMRKLNPVYEDAAPCSTSKICSGTSVLGCMLHAPLADKLIQPGDVVNWDICSQYRGYSVDTSRTRVVGVPSAEQVAAYDVALEMSRAVRAAMVPGASTTDLVRLADDVAKSSGFGLWEMFLGHGIGIDCHERPDMGVEEMALRANMVITVEPRIALDGRFLFANEDMVLVTENGGVTFGSFPREPLALV